MEVTGIKCEKYYTKSTEKKHINKKTLDFSDVLKSYEEKNKLTAENLRETNDWRNISDEAWDKLLERIDNYINFHKEMNREMAKRQQEAAQKAAREAGAGMKSIAASQAALAVASCGFYSGISSSEGRKLSLAEDTLKNDDESDWTHMISTDDQVLLRKARIAQDTKLSVLNEIEEIKNGGISSYSSLDVSALMLQKEDKDYKEEFVLS